MRFRSPFGPARHCRARLGLLCGVAVAPDGSSALVSDGCDPAPWSSGALLPASGITALSALSSATGTSLACIATNSRMNRLISRAALPRGSHRQPLSRRLGEQPDARGCG